MPSLLVGFAADSRSGRRTAPTSDGDAGGESEFGPRCQPWATAVRIPDVSTTRPVSS